MEGLDFVLISMKMFATKVVYTAFLEIFENENVSKKEETIPCNSGKGDFLR